MDRWARRVAMETTVIPPFVSPGMLQLLAWTKADEVAKFIRDESRGSGDIARGLLTTFEVIKREGR